MTREKKLEALLAVAKAYYDRGPWVQYDQRSMDRLIQLSPRRRKRLPPECATSQYTQFLDCSGFTSAVFLQAFGYELPHDLTWHMVDYLENRVYYKELTHNETYKELCSIEAEIKAVLQAGDLVCFDRGVGSGHIMLYLGNGEYTDCTSGKDENSYDFKNRHNRFYERGIWRRSTDAWFDKSEQRNKSSLFFEKVRRISISRPLDIVGDPTPDALARIGAAKGLVCGVLTSHPGAICAAKGELVTYTVFANNIGDTDIDIDITFSAPDNSDFIGSSTVKLKAFKGKTAEAQFTVETESDDAIALEAPKVCINGLNVYAPRVLLGKKPSNEAVSANVKIVASEINSGKSAVLAAAGKSEADIIHSLFYLHDTPLGDVLSRKEQNPKKDMGVYSMFGGIGVITPEAASIDGIRCTHITKGDLMPGDVILCSDDALGNHTYSSFYDEKKLMGKFEFDDKTHSISDKKLDDFIDSLFGRFCFIILRPFLAL